MNLAIDKVCNDEDHDIDDQKEFMNKVSGPISKRKGVLVLGGSFSPCHTEHVELLYEIKRHLEEQEGFLIVAAYLVITTDGYVYGKLKSAAISYIHRAKMCELTASKYPWCHFIPWCAGTVKWSTLKWSFVQMTKSTILSN